MTRLGIMGGTFDPIHNGHLIAAEESRHAFELDEVVFVPTGAPWQKEERDVAPAEDRYLMTVIATAANPRFSVSRIEIDREGPTYTIDTLRSFHEEDGGFGGRAKRAADPLGPTGPSRQRRTPRADGGRRLFFITGADAILQILTWKDPNDVLALATFIAASRPGSDLAGLDALDAEVRDRVKVLTIPALAISSTEIRERVAQGRPIRYLVPAAVAEYIRKKGLYA